MTGGREWGKFRGQEVRKYRLMNGAGRENEGGIPGLRDNAGGRTSWGSVLGKIGIIS